MVNRITARILTMTAAGMLLSTVAMAQPNFQSADYTIRNGGPAGGDCTAAFTEVGLAAKQQVHYEITGVEVCGFASAPVSRMITLTSPNKGGSGTIKQQVDVPQSLQCDTPSYDNVMLYDLTNGISTPLNLN